MTHACLRCKSRKVDHPSRAHSQHQDPCHGIHPSCILHQLDLSGTSQVHHGYLDRCSWFKHAEIDVA